MRRRFIFTLLFIMLAAWTRPAAVRAAAPQCFPETGFCIEGRIQEYWQQNGGLPVFGFPIRNPEKMYIDGKQYTVQRFERNTLELHPENRRPYDVLLGRLGADQISMTNRNWYDFPKRGDTGGCKMFAQTGHAVCGAVLQAWRAHGLNIDSRRGYSEAENLALFGLPLSDIKTETLADGQKYQVQWFERARFELHPENPAPYNVQLGLLGNEVLASDKSLNDKPMTESTILFSDLPYGTRQKLSETYAPSEAAVKEFWPSLDSANGFFINTMRLDTYYVKYDTYAAYDDVGFLYLEAYVTHFRSDFGATAFLDEWYRITYERVKNEKTSNIRKFPIKGVGADEIRAYCTTDSYDAWNNDAALSLNECDDVYVFYRNGNKTGVLIFTLPYDVRLSKIIPYITQAVTRMGWE
jgi:hypothetical protein